MEQMNNVQVAPPAKLGAGFSFKGLIDVITGPTGFFEKLRDNPKVLVPMIGLVLMATVSIYFLKDLMLELQIDAMRAGGQMSETQLQAMKQSSFYRMTPMFGALFIVLIPFITGSLGKLFGSFVMGGKATYWQVVSVMAYSEFVYFVSSAVSIPIQVMKESLVPTFSLATLAPNLEIQEPLSVLLAKISVPYAWEIVVAGIGLSIVFNFSRNKGYLLAVLSLGTLSALHILSAVVGKMVQ